MFIAYLILLVGWMRLNCETNLPLLHGEFCGLGSLAEKKIIGEKIMEWRREGL